MLMNDDDEINARLESPDNLINRLRGGLSPLSIFGVQDKPNTVDVLPPSSDELIGDLDKKIKIGTIKSSALDLMQEAMTELKMRLPEVPSHKLSGVIRDMSTSISNIEPKEERDSGQQVIIYKPTIMNESSFGSLIIND